MAIYNNMQYSGICPRCGLEQQFCAQLHFGLRDLIDYRIGDSVQWVGRKAVQNGGRPPDGTTVAEGYVVCPSCELDFFIEVTVHNDRIIKLSNDSSREPYLPDDAATSRE